VIAQVLGFHNWDTVGTHLNSWTLFKHLSLFSSRLSDKCEK